MAVGKSLIEVADIRLACKEHVACMVGDDIIWVRGNIVEEVVDIISGGLCYRVLLEANDADNDKKFFF